MSDFIYALRNAMVYCDFYCYDPSSNEHEKLNYDKRFLHYLNVGNENVND